MGKVLIIVLALLLVAATPVVLDRPLPRADLVFWNGRDVNTLDPQRMSWTNDFRIARCLFEPLVQHDIMDESFPIRPAAAEAFEVSDDGLTYAFTIRDSARWSNGEPLKSTDFLFAWRRAMLPDLVADYAKMFLLIRGAQDFYDWRTQQLEDFARRDFPSDEARAEASRELWEQTKAKFNTIVGVSTPDDRTLIVELERPVPFFIELCAFAAFCPVYPPLVEQYEQPNPNTGRLDRLAGWTKGGVLVSNGPFSLSRWRFKRDLRMDKNPHYWNADNIDLNSMHVQEIADPNAAVLAYQTGQLDWMAECTVEYRGDMISDKIAFRAEHADEVARLEAMGLDQFEIDRRLPADPRKHVHTLPSFATYFFNFNCQPTLPDGRPNPFADARVRRAFSMCVDKRAITEEIRRLGEPIARTLTPPGSISGYELPTGLDCLSDAATEAEREQIIQRARVLLAEAGYPNPAEDFPIVVDLVFNKDAGHDLIAQKLAKDWAATLGIQTSLSQKELKIYREDLKNANYIISRGSWYGDYLDPTTFLDLSKTGDGNNDRKYSSSTFDALLEQAATERDPDRRLEILSEAEAIIVNEDLPILPLFHYVTVYVFDPERVTGISTHPFIKPIPAWLDVLGDGVGRDQPKNMKPLPGSRPETPTTPALN